MITQFPAFFRHQKDPPTEPKKTTEEIFTWIFENNIWEDKESISGPGSTLKYTENLRSRLPSLIEHYAIKTVFDAPCGDLNWMRHLLPTLNVHYIGGDIVKPMIEAHQKNFSNEKTSFIHINLIHDELPKADLMICRDCLFHLSFAETRTVLENFVRSGTTYLLTTTHKNLDGFENRDIVTGNFRTIDLFSAPYHFPANPLERIDDWMAPEPEREMCLWSREQVEQALTLFRTWRS